MPGCPSVDPVPALVGKTVTGGRLNAAAALASLSPFGGDTFAPELAPFLGADVRTAAPARTTAWPSALSNSTPAAPVTPPDGADVDQFVAAPDAADRWFALPATKKEAPDWADGWLMDIVRSTDALLEE